jgi:hypothetical protein
MLVRLGLDEADIKILLGNKLSKGLGAGKAQAEVGGRLPELLRASWKRS